jgi:hypothetical protein
MNDHVILLIDDIFEVVNMELIEVYDLLEKFRLFSVLLKVYFAV